MGFLNFSIDFSGHFSEGGPQWHLSDFKMHLWIAKLGISPSGAKEEKGKGAGGAVGDAFVACAIDFKLVALYYAPQIIT